MRAHVLEPTCMQGWAGLESQLCGLTLRALALGEELGIPAYKLLPGHQVNEDIRHLHEVTPTFQQVESILRNLLRLSGKPGCGWLLGQRSYNADIGLVGWAMYYAPTIREALSLTVRYPALTAACATLHLEEDEQTAQFEYTRPLVSADLQRCMAERNIATFVFSLRRLFPKLARQQLLDIGFSFPRPAEDCPDFGDLRVNYDQSCEYVRFKRTLLDVPMPGNDAAVFCDMQRDCEKRYAALIQQQSLPQQVKRFLMQNEPLASLEETARHFCMSERTLRRKLQRHGISFRALRQEVVQALSLALLGKTRYSIMEIAQRLGYEDNSSFTRAFTKWQGITPGQYRKQALAGGSRADQPWA